MAGWVSNILFEQGAPTQTWEDFFLPYPSGEWAAESIHKETPSCRWNCNSYLWSKHRFKIWQKFWLCGKEPESVILLSSCCWNQLLFPSLRNRKNKVLPRAGDSWGKEAIQASWWAIACTSWGKKKRTSCSSGCPPFFPVVRLKPGWFPSARKKPAVHFCSYRKTVLWVKQPVNYLVPVLNRQKVFLGTHALVV